MSAREISGVQLSIKIYAGANLVETSYRFTLSTVTTRNSDLRIVTLLGMIRYTDIGIWEQNLVFYKK